jgi:hemoglobin
MTSPTEPTGKRGWPEAAGGLYCSCHAHRRGKRSMRGFPAALMIALLAQPAWSSPPAPQLAAAAEPSLYQRLGGYDAIAAVSDDFLGRLAHDPSLGRFFVGHSTNSVARIRQDIVDFLCHATGGPCVYRGRDLRTAHAGLGITGADWDQMVVLLNERHLQPLQGCHA